jgi:hypothetical protein
MNAMRTGAGVRTVARRQPRVVDRERTVRAVLDPVMERVVEVEIQMQRTGGRQLSMAIVVVAVVVDVRPGLIRIAAWKFCERGDRMGGKHFSGRLTGWQVRYQAAPRPDRGVRSQSA